MGPGAGMDAVEKRKISYLSRESNPEFQFFRYLSPLNGYKTDNSQTFKS
jgi:hypothetical protein